MEELGLAPRVVDSRSGVGYEGISMHLAPHNVVVVFGEPNV